MKLIGSSTSPYVRKVRVVMAEKKLDYQMVQEDVWSAGTTIGQSNPLGKVPCLIMEGAEAMFDSRVIVEYLDTLSPVGKLIPGLGRERAEVKTWEALADGLMDASILARMEAVWPGRTEAQRSQAWIDRQLGKVHAALMAMSRGLGDKPYCAGIHLSLADIAVGCALGYLDFRFPDIDWRQTYPNLAKLQDKLMLRASFSRIGTRLSFRHGHLKSDVSGLTHFDSQGQAHMVDVGDKPATRRVAVAGGRIEMLADTLSLIESGTARKGDVLGIARIAAIQAAKKTSDLIPLCHPLALTRVAVEFSLHPAGPGSEAAVGCTATVETTGPTGVEMEALTAVNLALLTIYDMCKAVDRGMTITGVKLLEKRGGKSGSFVAHAPANR